MKASADKILKWRALLWCLVLLVVISGCHSYSYTNLRKPYATSIPRKVKKGDLVKITLSSGFDFDPLEVKQVWADSLLLGNDVRAIPFAEIRDIEFKSPFTTLDALVLAFSILLSCLWAISASL